MNRRWVDDPGALGTRREPRPPLLGWGPSSLGLGRLLGRLPGANDGVVRVEETDVAGMTECIVLPVGHTELIFSARVESQIAQFLAHGNFHHDA